MEGNMPSSTRSVNLDLIRWMNGGHKATSKKLASLTNSNYVSKMATGDMKIGDYEARRIENAFELPMGWVDRENVSMLRMSATDFELQRVVVALRLLGRPYTLFHSWIQGSRVALAMFVVRNCTSLRTLTAAASLTTNIGTPVPTICPCAQRIQPPHQTIKLTKVDRH